MLCHCLALYCIRALCNRLAGRLQELMDLEMDTYRNNMIKVGFHSLISYVQASAEYYLFFLSERSAISLRRSAISHSINIEILLPKLEAAQAFSLCPIEATSLAALLFWHVWALP